MHRIAFWFVALSTIAAACAAVRAARADPFPEPGHGACFARFYHEGQAVSAIILELRARPKYLQPEHLAGTDYDFEFRMGIKRRGAARAEISNNTCGFYEGERRAACQLSCRMGNFDLLPSKRRYGSLILRPENPAELYGNCEETGQISSEAATIFRLDPAPAEFCLQLPAQ